MMGPPELASGMGLCIQIPENGGRRCKARVFGSQKPNLAVGHVPMEVPRTEL
jgi:hypothetical protein